MLGYLFVIGVKTAKPAKHSSERGQPEDDRSLSGPT